MHGLVFIIYGWVVRAQWRRQQRSGGSGGSGSGFTASGGSSLYVAFGTHSTEKDPLQLIFWSAEHQVNLNLERSCSGYTIPDQKQAN